MGLSGISPLSLLLIFFIIVLLFGTKRLRHLGKDLGVALRGFRQGLNDEDKQESVEKSEDKSEDKS